MLIDGFIDKRVVDVGCGDLELSKVFNFQDYTGYDLSTEALKIAKSHHPEWNFIHGSITDYPAEHADVVICLDVLIHQKTRDEYLKLIKALANATRKRLIISGYEDAPSDEYMSDICAYHEPLSKSLSDLGIFNETVNIGNYRGLSLMVADRKATGVALHKNDLPLNEFKQIVNHVDRKDLLRLIMDVSRNRLGFYTKTSIRAIEYPWMVEKIAGVKIGRIADIGAGVSPLPIVLGQIGYSVTTIDFHQIVRDLNNLDDWNEWGFLDYSKLISGIQSHNINVLHYHPHEKFDLIYSVSVVEHMPRKTWEQVLQWAAKWLKPGGRFILTLDLIPRTDALWNFVEGQEVEKTAQHGTLTDFRASLKRNGLLEKDFKIMREIPLSKTDLAFIECELHIRQLNIFSNILDMTKALLKHNR